MKTEEKKLFSLKIKLIKKRNIFMLRKDACKIFPNRYQIFYAIKKVKKSSFFMKCLQNKNHFF